MTAADERLEANCAAHPAKDSNAMPARAGSTGPGTNRPTGAANWLVDGTEAGGETEVADERELAAGGLPNGKWFETTDGSSDTGREPVRDNSHPLSVRTPNTTTPKAIERFMLYSRLSCC
jgi:hypothetical protein